MRRSKCLCISAYIPISALWLHLEPVHDLAEGRIAALKLAKKYSRTACTLCFFGEFRLALHPLIEIVDRLLNLLSLVAVFGGRLAWR